MTNPKNLEDVISGAVHARISIEETHATVAETNRAIQETRERIARTRAHNAELAQLAQALEQTDKPDEGYGSSVVSWPSTLPARREVLSRRQQTEHRSAVLRGNIIAASAVLVLLEEMAEVEGVDPDHAINAQIEEARRDLAEMRIALALVEARGVRLN